MTESRAAISSFQNSDSSKTFSPLHHPNHISQYTLQHPRDKLNWQSVQTRNLQTTCDHKKPKAQLILSGKNYRTIVIRIHQRTKHHLLYYSIIAFTFIYYTLTFSTRKRYLRGFQCLIVLRLRNSSIGLIQRIRQSLNRNHNDLHNGKKETKNPKFYTLVIYTQWTVFILL